MLISTFAKIIKILNMYFSYEDHDFTHCTIRMVMELYILKINFATGALMRFAAVYFQPTEAIKISNCGYNITKNLLPNLIYILINFIQKL